MRTEPAAWKTRLAGLALALSLLHPSVYGNGDASLLPDDGVCGTSALMTTADWVSTGTTASVTAVAPPATGPAAVLRRPPLEDAFWRLYREPVKLGHNDCSNKAGRYARLLVANGHQAEVVVVRPLRSPRTGPGLHAVVKAGNLLYCDPTFGRWSADPKQMGSPRFSIAVAQLDQWGEEFR